MSDDRGRAASLLRFASAFLITLWAGSLWTICVIVAPTLFATLPERRLAGQVAARLFHIEAWLGVTVAILLSGVLAWQKSRLLPGASQGPGPLSTRELPARQAFAAGKATLWLILLTAGAPLASELILGPMMDTARAANDMSRFGLLHGISAVLFFTACLSALALLWTLNRREG